MSGKLFLYLQDLGSTEVREIRRSNGERDVSFRLLNVPEATEHALFAKLFLNPDHHTKHSAWGRSAFI